MTSAESRTVSPPPPRLDVERIREDFPALTLRPHDKPLVYLDNAATSQKPRQVIETIARYYESENANVHRGVHHLSQLATHKYDGAREKVQHFINARHAHEIVFTSGNTDGLNLVASAYGDAFLNEGDEVLLSGMEHHSNIVPWQLLRERKGVVIKVVPVTDTGELDMAAFRELLSERTKVVSIVYVSNALGTVNPVKEIVDAAHAVGAVAVLDAAQAAPHLPIDVQALDCDFLGFSPHKMCGPTGVGVLYGKENLLDTMPPYRGGGDMITSVTFDKTLYAAPPFKFEAGTPNIAGVIGLGAAVDYLNEVGLEAIAAYEQQLVAYATPRLENVPGVRILGTSPNKVAVFSMILDTAHPHDVGQILDGEGVAVRGGHHCTQPLMRRFGIAGTSRASAAFYNTTDDIDRLIAALHKVNEVFA